MVSYSFHAMGWKLLTDSIAHTESTLGLHSVHQVGQTQITQASDSSSLVAGIPRMVMDPGVTSLQTIFNILSKDSITI
jgi:hypothetical protein